MLGKMDYFEVTPRDVVQWCNEGRINSQECSKRLEELLLCKNISLLSSISKLYGCLTRRKITFQEYCRKLYRLSEN